MFPGQGPESMNLPLLTQLAVLEIGFAVVPGCEFRKTPVLARWRKASVIERGLSDYGIPRQLSAAPCFSRLSID